MVVPMLAMKAATPSSAIKGACGYQMYTAPALIDSPPVGVVTDPAILSTLADGTVLVVRAFKTRKDLGRHALRAIEDVGGNLAGAVLNAVDFSRSEYKNSYYYYRHDEYYGEAADDARRDRDPPAKDQRPAAPPA